MHSFCNHFATTKNGNPLFKRIPRIYRLFHGPTTFRDQTAGGTVWKTHNCIFCHSSILIPLFYLKCLPGYDQVGILYHIPVKIENDDPFVVYLHNLITCLFTLLCFVIISYYNFSLTKIVEVGDDETITLS